MNIIVHPECSYEVVQKSDYAGSTKYLLIQLKKLLQDLKWVHWHGNELGETDYQQSSG